jgi:hypothetical protein
MVLTGAKIKRQIHCQSFENLDNRSSVKDDMKNSFDP